MRILFHRDLNPFCFGFFQVVRIFALPALAFGMISLTEADDMELVLERSADLRDWEQFRVDDSMISASGTLLVSAELPIFYRMKIYASSPEGFVLIPSGNFAMGDSFSEGDRNESPVHNAYISAFYMQITEVTKSQWDDVAGWAEASGYDIHPTDGWGKAADHPVSNVSWFDCVKFANARSEREGLIAVYTVSGSVMRVGTSAPEINYSANGYRLPTEAEWEKAARGGLSGNRFPWGDTISHNQANYFSQSSLLFDVSLTRGSHPDWDDSPIPFTSPVGTFSPNGYGLYDLAGNLLEWCSDWYTYYTDSTTSNPSGPQTGSHRVIRGGGWSYNANGCRVSCRFVNFYPENKNINTGFRLARNVSH